MSIKDIYPSIRPTLLLDFANSRSLDPRVQFTRSSSSVYYDGDLTTKAEENLLLQSQTFDDAVWSKFSVSVTANSVAAPDGTTTADTITSTTSTSTFKTLSQTIGPVTGYTGTFTISFYAKANTANFIQVLFYGGVDPYYGGYVNFDLANGVLGKYETFLGTPSITFVGNGWYRCVYTTILNQNVTAVIQFIDTLTAGRADNSVSSGSFYLWGAQLEQRARATAYIPTTTQAVTNYIPTLISAGVGVPRFDCNPTTGESLGLLIEEQRTNFLVASSNYSVLEWPKGLSFLSDSFTTAPDGTNTASKLAATITTGAHFFQQNITATANVAYTFSVYLKAAEETVAQVRISSISGAANCQVNLSTGVVSNTSTSTSFTGVTTSSTNVGNGWYRVSITSTCSLTSLFGVVILRAVGSDNYTGDGYSGLYIWGAQLELGAFPTSYIPTPLTYTSRASTATYRSADGTIRTAAANVARYEPNAGGGTNLIIEGASSNIALFSTSVRDSYDVGFVSGGFDLIDANGFDNATTSPDGSYSGGLLSINTIGGRGSIVLSTSFGVTKNTPVTFSCYLKAGSTTACNLELVCYTGGSSYTYRSAVTFTLSGNGSAGTVINTGIDSSTPAGVATIQNIGGGWYRCSISFSTYNGANALGSTLSEIRPASGSSSGSVYVWGRQVENLTTATSYIPSVETFSTRSSSATYYDSTGTLLSAGSGVARTTYNPSNLNAAPKLLLEPAATNLILYSEQFDNAVWTKNAATVTANATTAPDGTTTADKLAETAVNEQHLVLQNAGIAISVGSVFTVSVYAKASERTRISLTAYGEGYSVFDLANGTIVQTGNNVCNIQYVGNGWYRCSATIQKSNTIDGFYIITWTTVNAYLGTDGSGVFLWGAQIETGYPSSYIPTTSATVTRAADTSTSAAQTRAADVYSSSAATRASELATIGGPNFTPWFNNSEGTMVANYQLGAVLEAGNFGAVFDIRQDNNNRMLFIYNPTAAGNTGLYSAVGGVEQTVFYITSAVGVPQRLAAVYKFNDYAQSQNGGTIATDTSATVPVVTYASLGNNGNSVKGVQRISKIAYYPVRLTNTQLQAITAA